MFTEEDGLADCEEPEDADVARVDAGLALAADKHEQRGERDAVGAPREGSRVVKDEVLRCSRR